MKTPKTKKAYPELSHERRQKMLRIIDGHPNLPLVMYQWHKLRRCDEILDWLLRNRITGMNLFAWLRGEYQFHTLSMAKFILMKVDKEKEEKPILVGRDYLTLVRP